MVAAFAAPLLVLGDGGYRAPDGITDAVLLNDGSAWTLSARGEVAGFDPRGELVKTFQACPNRGARIDFAVSARGNRLGLSCGSTYQIFDLPSGILRHSLDVDTTDSAISADGRRVGILGERYEGGVSERESWLLVYDAISGEILRTFLGEWDQVEAIRGGWVLARGNDDGTELSLQGFVNGAKNQVRPWSYTPDAAQLAGGGWTPERSLSVRDGGRTVCVRLELGGACLRSFDGKMARTWRHGDRPFTSPGRGSRLSSPDGRREVEVLSTHLRKPGTKGWSTVVQVLASEDGERLIVVDGGGGLYDGHSGRLVGSTLGEVALSPDGRWLWYSTSRGSVRMGLASSDKPDLTPLPGFRVGAFGEDGTLWSVDGSHQLNRTPLGGTTTVVRTLPRLYEVTKLSVLHNDILIEHDQDDHWVHLKISDPAWMEEGSHAFRHQEDLRLVQGRALHSMTAASGERVLAQASILENALMRILPDGGGFMELAADEPTLLLKSMDGMPIRTLDLPGRGYAAWAFRGRVVVGLRDGRLAVVPL